MLAHMVWVLIRIASVRPRMGIWGFILAKQPEKWLKAHIFLELTIWVSLLWNFRCPWSGDSNDYLPHISHIMRKPVYAICEHQRRRSDCWAGRFESCLMANPEDGVFSWRGSHVIMEKYGKLSLNYHQIHCNIIILFLGPGSSWTKTSVRGRILEF